MPSCPPREADIAATLDVAGFDHRRVRNGPADIHYVVAGEGDAVVLLHGFPETWYAWRGLIPLICDRYRIVAPDLRGLGDSSRTPDGYDKKTIAGDVLAVIAAEHLEEYHLVGADMGAAVGFPLAMLDHDRVRTFAFIASALAGVGLERVYDFSAIGVNAWYWTLFQHELFGPMLTRGHERELLTEWAYRGSALRPDAIPVDAIEEYLRTYGTEDGWRTAIQYYSTLGQDAIDNRAALADGQLLRMPTLGIDGEQDARLSTSTLAQIASDVRGVLIPDCKHWIAEEQPAKLAAVLLDFFAHTGPTVGARDASDRTG
jgi:pimeloyl-ACP methyl ester carboxylesterase